MKKLVVVLMGLGLLFILFVSFMRSSIETPNYEVLRVLDKKIEIRLYPELILAETHMEATSYKESSSMGFRRVAGYIFGGNEKEQKISMTAPVMMEMGAQTELSFVMPKQYQFEQLPTPNDQKVQIIKKASRKLAVLRFGGYSSDQKIEQKSKELKEILDKEQIAFNAKLIYMGYNAPWDFIARRNEVAFELE